MFKINKEDKTIHITRGDVLCFDVIVKKHGESCNFQSGDVVRLKIFSKKDCNNVVLQKDFPIPTETEAVEVFLSESDTKIGGVINKPVDYWYEVELNPDTEPQTIIGYDDDGAKLFRLYPEGRDLTELDPVITPEDIPLVDDELDLSSRRPVENRVVARAIAQIWDEIKKLKEV